MREREEEERKRKISYADSKRDKNIKLWIRRGWTNKKKMHREGYIE